MKPITSLLSVTTVVATLLVGLEAAAQPSRTTNAPSRTITTRTADYTEQQTSGDQVVVFTGDELPVDGNSYFGPVIRPAPGPVRVGLIRPRMNFVPELLKSVENL